MQADQSFPNRRERLRRSLGLSAPSGATAAFAGELAVEQFARMRQRLPSLFVVLALVGLSAMLLTPERIDPFTRFGLPLILFAASTIRFFHWKRVRDVQFGPDQSRRELRRLMWMGPLMVALGSAWATMNFLDATHGERPLTIVLILLCSSAAATALSTFPIAALFALVAGLAPITTAMMLKGDGGMWVVAATSWAVAMMTVRLSVAELRGMEDNLALHHQLRDQANTDPLTGLSNRRAFDSALFAATGDMAVQPERVSLAVIDLDGFKAVNDRHGHGAGDELLRAVAGRLRDACPDGGTAARLGGDEFAILLWDRPHADGAALAATLRDSLAAPFVLGNLTLTISASIGTASLADTARDPESLYMQADLACYREKLSRRQARQRAA